MISKSDLEAKDRELYASGKEFTLNNGATVMIPSMPIGAVSAKFLRMQHALSEMPTVQKKDKNGALVFEEVEVEQENGSKKKVKQPVMVENEKWIDPTSPKGMEFFGKMLHAILNLSYDVTVEECDGLFSMEHVNSVISWFYTGREDVDTFTTSAGGSSDPTATLSADTAAELLGVPAEILS